MSVYSCRSDLTYTASYHIYRRYILLLFSAVSRSIYRDKQSTIKSRIKFANFRTLQHME